jgi:UDP-N-acetylmuramyl-tripeptide synthetase
LGFKTSQTPLKELANTTPYVVELHNLLKQAHDEGCEYASIEVSSHALDQNRVGGISFDVGAFTNLSQDHLDYHGTMEAYENAKWRLFSEFQPRMAVFNVDDEVGLRWAQNFKGESVTFGTRGRLTGMVSQITASSLDLKIQDSCDPLSVPMSFNLRVGGLFNYYNFLGASSILLALGFNLEQVRNASEGVSPVAGRFQGIANNLGASVIVDYAHTPDGLQKVLESAREVTSGKLIVIFGCGGDRDKSKRPLMGKIASKLADAVILTSDNPRTEDPLTILEEVASGLHPLTQQIQIVDRVEAINYGVSMLNSGDTLVIAGKGHENYQIVGKEKVHLDDSKIAHEALSLRTR